MNEPLIAVMKLRLSTVDLLSAAIEGMSALNEKAAEASLRLMRQHILLKIEASLKGGD
ncbi:hypothetical protein ES703_25773 [subsurface metagenome]